MGKVTQRNWSRNKPLPRYRSWPVLPPWRLASLLVLPGNFVQGLDLLDYACGTLKNVSRPLSPHQPPTPPPTYALITSLLFFTFFSEERGVGRERSSQTEVLPHEDAEEALGQGFGVGRRPRHARPQQDLPSGGGREIWNSASSWLALVRPTHSAGFFLQRRQQGSLRRLKDVILVT